MNIMLELSIAISVLFILVAWLYVRVQRLETDIEVLEDYAELQGFKMDELKNSMSKFDVTF
mgnify:FL=1|tara:strand:- start:324 stop:506 length:183 start_codon:yes stop_codon:yes gene_type:complete